MTTFVVIPRPGEPPVPTPAGFKLQWLTGFPVSISASEIRGRVKAGLSIEPFTGPIVAEAIRNNGLYF